MNFATRFILASLATWRVTHLLVSEDGPGDLVVRLRASLGDSGAGKFMDCFNCLSFWIAAPLAFLVSRRPRDVVLLWPAISGAACILEEVVYKPGTIHAPLTHTEGIVGDGMLWTEARAAKEHLG